MKPTLLSVARLPAFLSRRLDDEYNFHDRIHESDRAAFDGLAPRIRALVASGEARVGRDLLDRLPSVELIAVFGVGYDGIDVAAARERGITITNTPDVLTDDVADLAIGLLLAVAREILPADSHVRAGQWLEGPFRLTRRVSGARLGILGLGRIGMAIARRAQGFGMRVAYTGRHRRPDVAFDYHPTPRDLAAAVDFLVVAAPGGGATRGLVDATVLDALGPEGYLINIARGPVVDEAALLAALRGARIRGAALDVFASEPHVPAELIAMENVVLTPHMASGTVETRTAMGELTLANLRAHFEGRPLPTPVSA